MLPFMQKLALGSKPATASTGKGNHSVMGHRWEEIEFIPHSVQLQVL
jgi:hypothetical protein